MMDPRNPVFDLAPFNADNFPDFSDKEFGYLTPPTTSGLENIIVTEDSLEYSTPRHKEATSIDPDIILHYPAPMMSPILSEAGGSPHWDWDNELDSLTENK